MTKPLKVWRVYNEGGTGEWAKGAVNMHWKSDQQSFDSLRLMYRRETIVVVDTERLVVLIQLRDNLLQVFWRSDLLE